MVSYFFWILSPDGVRYPDKDKVFCTHCTDLYFGPVYSTYTHILYWAMAESLRLKLPKLRRTELGEPLGPVWLTWAEESLEGWEGSAVRVMQYLGSSPRDSRTITCQYVWLVRILHEKMPPANLHIIRSRLETDQLGPILESAILIPTVQRYGLHYGCCYGCAAVRRPDHVSAATPQVHAAHHGTPMIYPNPGVQIANRTDRL